MKNKDSCSKRLAKAIIATAESATTVFTALRACEVITWNWFWVLSPIIIPLGFSLLTVLISGLKQAYEEKAD